MADAGQRACVSSARLSVNLDHLESTRRDELSRLFVRLRGHGGEMPVSRAYVHLFKAM